MKSVLSNLSLYLPFSLLSFLSPFLNFLSLKYLWIMAREKTMSEELYNDILLRLRTSHQYDLEGLVKILHS